MNNLNLLMNNIESLILGNDVSLIDITSLCLQSMLFVEHLKNISGEEKKKLVIDALFKVFEKHNFDTTMLNIVPFLIETIIKVDKRIDPINKIKKCCF